MKFTAKTKIFLLSLFFISVAFSSSAAGLVPCGGNGEDPCTPCHLWEMADRIIKFILILALPVLVVSLIWGAILFLTAVGNPQQIERGKKVMWNAIIGVLIAF